MGKIPMKNKVCFAGRAEYAGGKAFQTNKVCSSRNVKRPGAAKCACCCVRCGADFICWRQTLFFDAIRVRTEPADLCRAHKNLVHAESFVAAHHVEPGCTGL
jgi:hypothetical protein